MPEPTPTLGIDEAVEQLRRCLAPGGDGRIGLEIEWLVADVEDRARSVPAEEVLAAAAGQPLSGGGLVTTEPGGQLELSAAARRDPRSAWRAAIDDAQELRRRVARAGLELIGIGLDPVRSAPISVDDVRYRAIEESFGRAGPSAMHMATNSAGLQLNVDLGPDPLWTWRIANDIGPVLLALFANSPLQHGEPTGWASTRQLLWRTVPDRRSVPVPTWSIDAWVQHALDMPLLFIRDGDEGVILHESFSFRRWILEGHAAGHPTVADLDHHLTTIFPPVRPRGWLELRMIDSVPDTGAAVAVALGATVLRERELGVAAVDACHAFAGRWAAAARSGCADPGLAGAGLRILDIAAEAIEDTDLAAACRDWSDRYPARRRSPADDRLDEFERLSRP